MSKGPRKLIPLFLFTPPNPWSCQAKSTGWTPPGFQDCRQKGMRNFIPQYPNTSEEAPSIITTRATITHLSNPIDYPEGGTPITILVRQIRRPKHREVRPPVPGHTAVEPSLSQAGPKLLIALGFVCLLFNNCVMVHINGAPSHLISSSHQTLRRALRVSPLVLRPALWMVLNLSSF